MISKPPLGSTTERSFRVEAEHLIDFTQNQMPAVLCTPALIGFLERTARAALEPHLEAGESSVGIEIEISHLAPTPPGQTVRCLARVIHVEGPRINFQVEARDEQELIARGLHKRQIIRIERFAQALRRKCGGGG